METNLSIQTAANLANPALQTSNQQDVSDSQMFARWEQNHLDNLAAHEVAQKEIAAMHAKFDKWDAAFKQRQTNFLSGPISCLANHRWKIMGSVAGAAFAGTIAKTILCCSFLGCGISAASGMILGTLATSKLDNKTK